MERGLERSRLQQAQQMPIIESCGEWMLPIGMAEGTFPRRDRPRLQKEGGTLQDTLERRLDSCSTTLQCGLPSEWKHPGEGRQVTLWELGKLQDSQGHSQAYTISSGTPRVGSSPDLPLCPIRVKRQIIPDTSPGNGPTYC